MPTTLPAHASLFTSLYPRQLSVSRNGEKIPDEATTLAEILQGKGYATAAFVSTLVLNARYGLNQGFQTYDDISDGKQRAAEITITKAVRWLQNHCNDQFFLFVHLFDPHIPYDAPVSFRRSFNAPPQKTPPICGFVADPGQLTTDIIRKTIAAYDAEIAYADWAIGELLRKLEQLDLKENTIIIVVSDHGESLGELLKCYGYAFDHGEFLYFHQLHIPMIIRLPGMASSGKEVVHTNPVSILDIMPTILGLLQIKPPVPMAGHSLIPIIRGESISNNAVFSERRTFKTAPKPYLQGEDYSIIEGKRHLIFSTIRDSELYNLIDDPREISDLRQELNKTDILTSKLQIWLKRYQPLFDRSGFEEDGGRIEQLRSLGYVQ
jgi:arylsulfatase A-like enzyme